jgi:hypothetical protein
MTIIARFGAAQANLGFQFLDASGTLLGSRTTSGITALAETGSYIASPTPPVGAVAVYWNDSVTLATALEDLRDAFAIEALESSGGTGAFTITVTVTDGADPLEGAKVRITEGATTILGTTDPSGNAAFSLDAATYTVGITKSGFQFDQTTRTVTGEEAGTLVNDLEMTARSVPSASADPDLCIVFFDVGDFTGDPKEGVVVTFELVTIPSVGSSGAILTNETFSATSDSLGRGSIELEKGVEYRARCELLFQTNHRRFTPTGDTFDLATLI